MRADGLEQVERAEGVLRHLVPEAVVAPSPDQPHVAPLDFLGCERDPAIHVVEVVLTGLRNDAAVRPAARASSCTVPDSGTGGRPAAVHNTALPVLWATSFEFSPPWRRSSLSRRPALSHVAPAAAANGRGGGERGSVQAAAWRLPLPVTTGWAGERRREQSAASGRSAAGPMSFRHPVDVLRALQAKTGAGADVTPRPPESLRAATMCYSRWRHHAPPTGVCESRAGSDRRAFRKC